MLNQIIEALKEVFASLTPEKSFIQSAIKLDFKIGDQRTQLMQLCFSNLASWPLILILLAIGFNPFWHIGLLQSWLNHENFIFLTLLDGRLPNMAIFFVIFLFLAWLVRLEYLWIGILFFLISRGEIHINLATVAVMAIYLERLISFLRLIKWCESRTQMIWRNLTLLQLVAWLVTAVMAISSLDQIQKNYLFTTGDGLTRFNFLAIVILMYHVFSHLFLSIWGHFYFQSKPEPSYIPIYFSTVNWFNFYKPSKKFKEQVSEQAEICLQKNTEQMKQVSEMVSLIKDKGLGVHNLNLQTVLNKERVHLKQLGKEAL